MLSRAKNACGLSIRRSNPRLTALAVCGVLFFSGLPVEAWPADAYRNMIYDALRLLPPSLGRILWRRNERLIQGVHSLDGMTASRLARDGHQGTLSTDSIKDVEARINRGVSMINSHQSFSDLAVELGGLLRVAADLSDPTIWGAGKPELVRVASEYQRFIGLHLLEIPLVHDRKLPSPLTGGSVQALLQGLTQSTRLSVLPLAKAFWNNGGLVPATQFDYRSVPYAEASLAYSRSVTAASYLWLVVWKKANGDFTGYRFSYKNKH